MKRPLLFVLFAAPALLLLSLVAAAQEPAAGSAAPPASAQEPAAPPASAPVAEPAAPPALTGDPARGRQLAYTCQGCHGVTGYKNAYPAYHVPYIGGQSAAYLTNALNEYRQGTRPHPTMQAQARSFSDQDIADLTTFLSGVTP